MSVSLELIFFFFNQTTEAKREKTNKLFEFWLGPTFGRSRLIGQCNVLAHVRPLTQFIQLLRQIFIAASRSFAQNAMRRSEFFKSHHVLSSHVCTSNNRRLTTETRKIGEIEFFFCEFAPTLNTSICNWNLHREQRVIILNKVPMCAHRRHVQNACRRKSQSKRRKRFVSTFFFVKEEKLQRFSLHSRQRRLIDRFAKRERIWRKQNGERKKHAKVKCVNILW